MKVIKHRKRNSVYIGVKDLCFTFLCEPKFKYSLITPIFLSFFKEEYSTTDEEYQTNQMAVEKLMKESEKAFPILPEHLKVYHFRGVYKEIGCGIVRCSDGKFRKCKAVKFNFECEGHPYSELFFIDKSIEEGCAILGSTFWSKCDILK